MHGGTAFSFARCHQDNPQSNFFAVIYSTVSTLDLPNFRGPRNCCATRAFTEVTKQKYSSTCEQSPAIQLEKLPNVRTMSEEQQPLARSHFIGY